MPRKNLLTTLAHFEQIDKDQKERIMSLAEALLRATEEIFFLHKRLENAENDARTDVLTGLGNKRYLMEEVRRLKSLYDRTQLPPPFACIVAADMDNLKPINDNNGHKAGDEALRNVGLALKSATRTNDIVARVGGDEFVAVALFRNRKEISTFKARMSAELNKGNGISTSIGFYFTKLDAKFNFEKAMKIADQRMYKIKQQKKADG